MQKPHNNFLIEYESDDFPPAENIPPWGRLSITWDDVLGAALTVGRPPGMRYIYGCASLYESIFRLSLVRMALEQNWRAGGELQRTMVFDSLDPTEKGAVNYFLGMVFCKLFSEKILKAPWLLHFDAFGDELRARLGPGRSRPDFIGHDLAGKRWHIFESKGRATKPGKTEINRAKRQAMRVTKVEGRPVALHIAAITYFGRDVLKFYWCDPDPEETEKSEEIDIRLPEGVWGNYYEPASDLIRAAGEASQTARRSLPTSPIEELDIQVKAHPKIQPLLTERSWQRAHDISLELADVFLEEGYRPDGLRVKAGESWGRRRSTGEDD